LKDFLNAGLVFVQLLLFAFFALVNVVERVSMVRVAVRAREVDSCRDIELPARREELREPGLLPLSECLEDEIAVTILSS